MKLVKVLSLALGLMLVVSAASFAQTSLTTTSAQIPIAPNAQTGLVGEVDFTPNIISGTIPAGESINVSFAPANISSLSDLQIAVLGCPANFVFATQTTFGNTLTQTCSGATVTARVTATNVTIGVAAGSTPLPMTQSTLFIRIFGVRVNASATGLVPPAILNASVTASTGVGTVTNTLVPVAFFAEPITLSGPTITTGQVPQTGGSTTATVSIQEASNTNLVPFNNAFETKTAGSGQTTRPTQLVLTVTPPAPFSVSAAAIATSTASTVSASVASVVNNVVTVNINSQAANAIENIDVTLTLTSATGQTVPLTPGSFTVSATLAPPATGNPPFVVGPDTDATTEPVAAAIVRGPLRYTVRQSNVVTIALNTVTQVHTTLLAVFNVVAPATDTVVGFNTGIAILNTSGTGPLGGVAQPGTITVTMYPADGTASKTFTTSATAKPGLGLDANGLLPASATWNVLLSELVSAAGFTGTSWQGAIKFTTNFSGAHGLNFIADPFFQISSHGYPMLVLPSDGVAGIGYDN